MTVSPSDYGYCDKCGSLLPVDHGFSKLCERCDIDSPLNQIAPAKIDKPQSQDLRQVGRKNVLPERKPRIIRKKIEPNKIDIGIEEDRSVEELEEYKLQSDKELAEIKLSLKARRLPVDMFQALERRRADLAIRVQYLARLIGKRKREERKLESLNGHSSDEDSKNAFAIEFIRVAKANLSGEIFDKLCEKARILSEKIIIE